MLRRCLFRPVCLQDYALKTEMSNVEHRMSNIEVSRSAMDDRHPDSTLITFHRIDIDLQNSSPNPVIETSVPAADYLNFYTTGTPTGGVTGVKSFGTITYKNVYPGIDLQFIAGNDRLFEYNFIVQPGGDINAIRLKVAGPEKIKHVSKFFESVFVAIPSANFTFIED